MRNIIDWITGWWQTFVIRVRYPEAYKTLASYEHDPDDFVEVPRP